MKKNRDVKPPLRNHQDLLDELIENEEVGEMGLLDLIFIEEILNQKRGRCGI